MNPDRFTSEVIFRAVRSRGPGGQNVNKVSSAAQMSWHVAHSHLYSEPEKTRIIAACANLINSEGYLQLRSDEYRDLERNKKRCLEKLALIVAKALFIPKKRKKTKPTRASKVRRRETKTKASELKKMRRKVRY